MATLFLGIGANAAILPRCCPAFFFNRWFNHDEDRLLYIHQSAFGDSSTFGFSMVSLGEVVAGIVGIVFRSHAATSGSGPSARSRAPFIA